MKEKLLNNCKDRTIVNQNILATNNYDFVDKEYIKKNCDKNCKNINNCYRILELLNDKKYDLALNLLSDV